MIKRIVFKMAQACTVAAITMAGHKAFFPKQPIGGWIMGAGPTALLLKQKNGWTYGTLANDIMSFADTDGRQNVSSTFLKPFIRKYP